MNGGKPMILPSIARNDQPGFSGLFRRGARGAEPFGHLLLRASEQFETHRGKRLSPFAQPMGHRSSNHASERTANQNPEPASDSAPGLTHEKADDAVSEPSSPSDPSAQADTTDTAANSQSDAQGDQAEATTPAKSVDDMGDDRTEDGHTPVITPEPAAPSQNPNHTMEVLVQPDQQAEGESASGTAAGDTDAAGKLSDSALAAAVVEADKRIGNDAAKNGSSKQPGQGASHVTPVKAGVSLSGEAVAQVGPVENAEQQGGSATDAHTTSAAPWMTEADGTAEKASGKGEAANVSAMRTAAGQVGITAAMTTTSADPAPAANGGLMTATSTTSAASASTPRDVPAAMNLPLEAEDNTPDALNVARVARGLQSALQQQGGSVTLRMSPPDLGLVRIEMSINSGTVSATLQSEAASVRQLLTQQLAQLRQSLESQGLNVERLTVQTLPGANGSHHASGDGDQQEGRAPWEEGRSRGRFDQRNRDDSEEGQRDGESDRREPRTFAEMIVDEVG